MALFQFEDLPDDIQFKTLSYLSVNELLQIRNLSRYHNKLSCDESKVWKHIIPFNSCRIKKVSLSCIGKITKLDFNLYPKHNQSQPIVYCQLCLNDMLIKFNDTTKTKAYAFLNSKMNINATVNQLQSKLKENKNKDEETNSDHNIELESFKISVNQLKPDHGKY